jgi:hypothetical protein
LFLRLTSPGAAQEPAAVDKRTPDPEARAGCEVNLTKIYDALHQYRKKHNQLPDGLSDLVPEFIQNRNVLICPYIRKTGQLSEWRKNLNPQPGQDRSTYYYFEFCLEKYPKVAPANSGKTYRDYKEAQTNLLGEVVPIVRCLAHSPVLNLSYNGLIFGDLDAIDKHDMDYWEENFAHLYPDLLLEPDPVFAALRVDQSFRSQKTAPATSSGGSRILDLSRYFNFVLHDFPPADGPTNNLSALPKGLREWDGITFDVRGVIHLTRGSRNLPFPIGVDDIVVMQQCSRIHLLHGFVFSEPPSGDVARLAIQFSGEQEHSAALSHTGDNFGHGGDPGSRVAGRSDTLVWKTTLEVKHLKTRTVCLYHTSMANPHPEAEITSLSFSSAMTEAAPFLLAVTLE